jgi:hypothetical protein
MRRLRSTLATMCLAVPALADAQPAAPQPPAADDGYCDYVEGAAAATAATLSGPQLFGQFGYIEQPSFAETPAMDPSNLRLITGIRYSFTNLMTAGAMKARAKAECRRHNALFAVRGASSSRAIEARLRVYEEARPEAERILREVRADLEARRTTTREATSTRLRVEELRALEANARRDLAALPPADQRPLGSLLTEYRGADADMEASDAKLRRMQAYEINVRAGLDRFIEGPNNNNRFFAVLQVGFNFGALWMGGDNDRAAAGRRRYTRSGHDPLGATLGAVEQLRAMADVEEQRAAQIKELVADLGQQLEALARLGTEETKRFRETVWFDWLKARADLAYAEAHVTALREVIGAQQQSQ